LAVSDMIYRTPIGGVPIDYAVLADEIDHFLHRL
jgi:hypothetical protein